MNGVAEGLGIDPAICEQLIAEASQLKEDGQRKMSVSDELFAQLQGAMQNFYTQKQQLQQEDMANMQQSQMQQMGALMGAQLFEFGIKKRSPMTYSLTRNRGHKRTARSLRTKFDKGQFRPTVTTKTKLPRGTVTKQTPLGRKELEGMRGKENVAALRKRKGIHVGVDKRRKEQVIGKRKDTPWRRGNEGEVLVQKNRAMGEARPQVRRSGGPLGSRKMNQPIRSGEPPSRKVKRRMGPLVPSAADGTRYGRAG